MNKAVFLNRDSCAKLLPETIEAVKLLNNGGFKVIVISNQPEIAKGSLSEDMLQTADKKMQKDLLKSGVFLDAIYYCPHHPKEGLYPYKKDCECRKPKAGLINRALKVLNIDPSLSFVIGEEQVDIEAGRNAQLNTILVTNNGISMKAGSQPTHTTKNLFEATKWLISKS
jgi:D-glycero-D-manno-heptose 1,7-bisphosphate phosphatase